MDTQTRFTTRDDAIQHLIVDPIEAGAVDNAREEFNIEQIADTVLTTDAEVEFRPEALRPLTRVSRGPVSYRLADTYSGTDGPEQFWTVVESAAMKAAPTRPTIAETMGTLDELAAATRADDRARYASALATARAQDLSVEQIKDSHKWGSFTGPHANNSVQFDWDGTPRSKGPGVRTARKNRGRE